jgi:thioredoxin reductase (NADPH)
VQRAGWIAEYEIPVFQDPITCVEHKKGQIECIQFGEKQRIAADCLFTTRGDVFHNKLAQELGAEIDAHGQVVVDKCQRTSVAGLYAAGCVTPANCQMVIAAGNGATAAQAINRDLFEESLACHSLRKLRQKQLQTAETGPQVLAS